jgi:hypothetical protein
MKDMHVILYTSEYTGKAEEINQALKDIVSSSKRNNPKAPITGALFFHNGRFLQIIEGPKESLDDLMSHITKDYRSKNVLELVNEPILQRSFSLWNMDSFNLSTQEPLDLKELKLIRDVYKYNLVVKTDILIQFFKSALKSHDLVC